MSVSTEAAQELFHIADKAGQLLEKLGRLKNKAPQTLFEEASLKGLDAEKWLEKHNIKITNGVLS